jgi:hypothetical protein
MGSDSNFFAKLESDPIYHTAFAIRKQGIFTERIAAASVSTTIGRSKLVRHASATLREGTGAENGTDVSMREE